jgi:hypothetical protein
VPSPFESPFSPAELGDDEDFVLDVSELIPNKTALIYTNRKDMLAKFEKLLRVQNKLQKLEASLLKDRYNSLRKECINFQQRENSYIFEDDCCMLAVLARLLHSTALRVKKIEQYGKRNM